MEANKKKKIAETAIIILFGIVVILLKNKVFGLILIFVGLLVSYKEILGFLKFLCEVFGEINPFGKRKPEQNMKNSKQGIQIITRDVNAPIITINAPITPQVQKKISEDKEIRNISEVKPKKFAFTETKEIDEEKIGYQESKDLLTEIYSHLEKSKPLGIIAEMSLRLCQKLKMDNYLEWLKKEVYGYEVGKDNKPLELRKRDEIKYPRYRSINAELWIAFERDHSKVQKVDLRLFISRPISIIENWINSASDSNQLVLHDAPPKIIVDKLEVNPNEKVPYITQTSSLRNLLIEFRLDLIKFLEQAKKEIDKYE